MENKKSKIPCQVDVNKLKTWLKNEIKYYKEHDMYPAYCLDAVVEAYEHVLLKIDEFSC